MYILTGLPGWQFSASGKMLAAVRLLTRSRPVADSYLASQDSLSIVLQIIAGLAVAALVGLVGAWYQMRRRRARPFLVPQHFTRKLVGGQPMISVPAKTSDELSQSMRLIHQSDMFCKIYHSGGVSA